MFISDPGSEFFLSPIPGSGFFTRPGSRVKKGPDPASGSATLPARFHYRQLCKLRIAKSDAQTQKFHRICVTESMHADPDLKSIIKEK